jgi:hypothetical protein
MRVGHVRIWHLSEAMPRSAIQLTARWGGGVSAWGQPRIAAAKAVPWQFALTPTRRGSPRAEGGPQPRPDNLHWQKSRHYWYTWPAVLRHCSTMNCLGPPRPPTEIVVSGWGNAHERLMRADPGHRAAQASVTGTTTRAHRAPKHERSTRADESERLRGEAIHPSGGRVAITALRAKRTCCWTSCRKRAVGDGRRLGRRT